MLDESNHGCCQTLSVFSRQRTEQQIKFLRRERVLCRKLLQQDEVLQESQTLRAEQLKPRYHLQALLAMAATHHIKVQGFAEADGLHQQQQPAPHLLRFEKQAVDRLD